MAAGKSISRPVYNHQTGRLEGAKVIGSGSNPLRILILDGTQAFYPQLNIAYPCLKIFLDADVQTRHKLLTNVYLHERGYNPHNAMQAVANLTASYAQYVEHFKMHADIILSVNEDRLYESDAITRCLCSSNKT